MKTTLCFHHVFTVALVMLAGFTICFAASLDGIPGPDQEAYSDSGSTNWAHTPVHVRRSVQYCGTRLVDAIRNICKGNTYAPVSRRSDQSFAGNGLFDNDLHDASSNSIDVSENGENYWDIDNPMNDFELMWPHNGKALALKVLTEGSSHQRFRRTIIDECCKKPCTAMEMIKYCGSPRRSGSAGK